jgi:hypothetical protein
MKRILRVWGLAAVWFVMAGAAHPVMAGDPAKELFAAKRLACAFVQGVTAGFTPQGNVSVKPPLDPNTPGLAIEIVDRENKRALLEEDARETTGVFMTTPTGLTVMARYPDGGVTLVTVYPMYSGASDNFLMVSSHHGASTAPRMTQRYGLCRIGAAPSETPPASPPAASGQGHK